MRLSIVLTSTLPIAKSIPKNRGKIEKNLLKQLSLREKVQYLKNRGKIEFL